MKINRLIIITVLFCILFTSIGFTSEEFNTVDTEITQESVLVTEKAKVLQIIKDVTEDELNNPVPGETKQIVEIKILSGDYKDQILTLDNHLSNHMYYDIRVKEGDRITIAMEIFENQDEYTMPETFISGFERDRYEFVILFIFMLALLVIGGLKGAKTIVSLSLTGIVILKYLIPSILDGKSPVFVSVLSAIIITAFTLFIIAGINRKSISAIIGTAAGVIIAGVLAYVIGSMANLTGLSSSEATMLMFIPQAITFNFKGLLFAGIIIGTLGAVMDIAMSISSSMYEIKEIEPTIHTKELISAGINIGKDVMGTMTNTLILAYTGTSLPLLLIFMAYDYPAIEILNLDLIATEIIRSIAGSIGIVLAIPFTAISCGIIIEKVATDNRNKKRVPKRTKEHSDETPKKEIQEPVIEKHSESPSEDFSITRNTVNFAEELDELFGKEKKNK